MSFRGFYIESKAYCNYDYMTTKEKIKWWLAYPKAWLIFQYLTLKDYIYFNFK